MADEPKESGLAAAVRSMESRLRAVEVADVEVVTVEADDLRAVLDELKEHMELDQNRFCVERELLPGNWTQFWRTYTAFVNVPTPVWCEHRVRLVVTADRVVEVSDVAQSFAAVNPNFREVVYYDHSLASITLCGSDEAVGMAKAVADGRATLGILADWVEDDIPNRVKGATLPTHKRHRTSEDAVTHLLTVMRCHKPAVRKRK